MQQMDRVVLERVTKSLRRRAEQVEPSFSTMQIIAACFPGTVVTGRRMRDGIDETLRVDQSRDRRVGRGHRREHVIVYNRELPAPEQRYAIAHAIAHIIFDGMHHFGCHLYDPDCELRADRFADELLVPLDELAPYVCAWPSADPDEQEAYLDQVDLIASHFNVPARVVHKRIQELPFYVKI